MSMQWNIDSQSISFGSKKTSSVEFRSCRGRTHQRWTSLSIIYCFFPPRHFLTYSHEYYQHAYFSDSLLKNIPFTCSDCHVGLFHLRYDCLNQGFMLSVLCNRTNVTVGASTAIFGVLGGFIAYLVINWVALERFGPVRGTLACIIGILVVFSLLFSIGSSIDGIAHIGGLVSGLLISLAILPGMQEKNKIMTGIGAGGIVAMNLITFLLFFLTDWLMCMPYIYINWCYEQYHDFTIPTSGLSPLWKRWTLISYTTNTHIHSSISEPNGILIVIRHNNNSTNSPEATVFLKS